MQVQLLTGNSLENQPGIATCVGDGRNTDFLRCVPRFCMINSVDICCLFF